MNEPASRRLLALGGAAFILAMTVLAYLPATRGGFVWDDEAYVEDNPLLHEPDGLWRIWFSTDQPSQYFPLVYTAFRAQYALWGLDTTGYHLTNVLLHAINALLVWNVLRRLRIPGAFIAAAIFAVHPVHVESVAWITELKNVLMLFFFLLSVRAWLAFVDPPAERRGDPRLYGLSLLLYLAALLAKTTACTLPAALVATLWLRKIPLDRRRWRYVGPYVLLGLAMGLLTMWWERFHQNLHPTLLDIGLVERPLIAGRALWFYLGKLIWPVNLAFSYPRWTIDAANPALWLWPLSWLAAAWALWRWRERLGRGTLAALAFFAATLSPMLGLIMLWTFQYSFVADHYQYVASLGPIALVAAGGTRLARAYGRRGLRVGGAAALGLLLILGGLTHRQARAYESRETLWRDTLRKNPASWMARINLGVVLFEEERVDEAVEQYRLAIETAPTVTSARFNLGTALAGLGRWDEAAAVYRDGLSLDPGYADGYRLLAYALESAGDVDEAARHYRRAIELDPANESAHKMYARLLAAEGRTEDALAHYTAALEIAPDDAAVHFNLGNLLRSAGRVEEAAAEYRHAVESSPQDAAAHNNLGSALLALGRREEGIEYLREALRLDPGYAAARRNLDDALAAAGDATALPAPEDTGAAALDEQQLRLRNDRAEALAEQGRLDEALARYREILRARPDWPEPLTSAAWILATRPDAADGDRREAVELAERAATVTRRRNPLVLYTLSAAYAAAGRGDDARRTSEAALELATAAGAEKLAQQIRRQLQSYGPR